MSGNNPTNKYAHNADVSGRTDRNCGYYGEVKDSKRNTVFHGVITAASAVSSENHILYGENTVSASTDLEYGFKLYVNGTGATNTSKWGGYVGVTGSARVNVGFDSYVEGANSVNTGIQSLVAGSTGTGKGAYIVNSLTNSAGGDTQWGGYFITDAFGSLTTTKYGVHARTVNSADANFGVNAEAEGASGSNYGVYSIVFGSSGSSNYAVRGENSSTDGAGGDGQWGGDFSALGFGATTTKKIGVEASAINSARTNTGVKSTVSDGNTANYGVHSTVIGTSGSNYAFYGINNSTEAVTDTQWGSFLQVDGPGVLGTTKVGSEIVLTNSGGRHSGVIVNVDGATNINIGVSSTITGTTGIANYAVLGVNASSNAGGADTQWGGYFDSSGGGTAGTVKYGVQSIASGSGDVNYGVHITADSATINHSLYAIGGRHTFYHDPNSELGINDPEGYGDIVYFGGGGSTFNAGDVVYLDNAGDWLQTNAAATGTAINMLAVALGAAPSDGLLVRGYVRYSGWGLNSGEPLYLETGVPGGITGTAPSAAGEVVRIIGYCTDAVIGDKIYFNPDGSWIEI